MARIEFTAPVFCPNCEFAGDIPEDSAIQDSVVTEEGVQITYFLDADLRVSKGVVDPEDPFIAPGAELLVDIINNCGGCDGCALREAGFTPMEVSDDEKLEAMTTAINAKAGAILMGQESVVNEIKDDKKD